MSVSEKVISVDEINQILAKKFNEEWNGTKRMVPFSEVLKKRGSRLNVNDGFRIKPGEKSGDNLELAGISIIQFIEYINDHIERLNEDFRELEVVLKQHAKNPLVDISIQMYKVRINAEILAYLLKTIIDKIIVLLGLLESSNKIDSIGALLKNNTITTFCYGVLQPHREYLDKLNSLNNGYKHTFSNLQLASIVPQVEPAMFVIYKPWNSTKVPTEIHHMLCSNAIDNFNRFLKDVKNYTKGKK